MECIMEDPIKTTEATAPRDERVGALAYMIWEREGRPEGKAEEHWFLACTIIDAQDSGIELEDLPPWLSRAEEPPVQEATKMSGKIVHHPRHKAAA
jgi:hypothetical protein